MVEELAPLARTIAEPYYEAALPAHDRFHANRVRDLALRLANECDESVDTEVLSAAAWLHDIGRPLERTGEIENHDEWATREAAELLEAEGVSPDRITAIQRCIRSHSIRASSPEPVTVEAKLLFDADKLDAIGAVGIVRLACIVGERSGRNDERYAILDDASARRTATTDHPDVALLREWAKERRDALYTSPGRRLGASRWEFVAEFFGRFTDELGLEGER